MRASAAGRACRRRQCPDECARTARIAVTTSASLTGVFGPRFAATPGAAGAGAIARYTVARGTRKTAQIIVGGYGRPVSELTACLIAAASSTRP